MLPTEYEIYLAVAGSILLLLAVLLAFIISISTSRKRKARLEREIIETHYKTREQTLLQVSRDLHDDIGASLSGINLFNQLLQQQIQNGQDKNASAMSEKINIYIEDIVAKVSDMTWLFKPGNNNVQALADKIQLYAADISGTKAIAFSITVTPAAAIQNLSLLQQKNSYLICKEATNNAVKYSCGTALEVNMDYINGAVLITITDNGKGFSTETGSNGNGLKNLQQRAREINGELIIKSTEGQGVTVKFSFPIAILSHIA